MLSSPIKPPKLSFTQKKEVFEIKNNDTLLLEISIKQTLQTQEGHVVQLEPLGQKYVSARLSDSRRNEIDHIYGVYFSDNATLLDDKRFDIDKDDSMIINNEIYELIFKRISDDAVYIEDDKLTYKNILLTTNAQRCNHNVQNPVMGNKGYKYKHIIAPLVVTYKIISKKEYGHC